MPVCRADMRWKTAKHLAIRYGRRRPSAPAAVREHGRNACLSDAASKAARPASFVRPRVSVSRILCAMRRGTCMIGVHERASMEMRHMSEAAWLPLLATAPKAELHVHLEGTMEADLAFEIAARNGVDPGYDSPDAMREAYVFHDLPSFLTLYYRNMGVLPRAGFPRPHLRLLRTGARRDCVRGAFLRSGAHESRCAL